MTPPAKLSPVMTCLFETQETKITTFRHLLVEGDLSGSTDYDITVLIEELDGEKRVKPYSLK
ncbi:type II toxin-antitoxin system ParD family antitoxin [Paraglaciecola chathamensis]|uniref:type II toxin-antitoxin system ParD family antitoxin n=1 Tax=Paraglaciecola chathamensis TaxID=368405 RepID=UPI002FCDC974